MYNVHGDVVVVVVVASLPMLLWSDAEAASAESARLPASSNSTATMVASMKDPVLLILYIF